MKKNIYMMCGIPGSGKTTWAKKNRTNNSAYISRDDIRFSLISDNDKYYAKEREVIRIFYKNIQEALNNEKISDVYIDATNNTIAARKMVLNHLDLSKIDYDLIVINFKTNIEKCLARNALRKGRTRVPDKAIYEMSKQHQDPTFNEKYTYSNIINIEE